MKHVTEKARYLRSNATEAENILGDELRANKIGKKFVRQKPIIFEYNNIKREFIADFYCSQQKLAIEIDGKIHQSQQEYDEIRTEIMNYLGIQVIRFSNKQVINAVGSVVEEIKYPAASGRGMKCKNMHLLVAIIIVFSKQDYRN